jgi:hypothetical protein
MLEAEGGREAGIGRDEFVLQLSGAVARIHMVSLSSGPSQAEIVGGHSPRHPAR